MNAVSLRTWAVGSLLAGTTLFGFAVRAGATTAGALETPAKANPAIGQICRTTREIHRGTKVVKIRRIEVVDGHRRIVTKRRRELTRKTVNVRTCTTPTTYLDPTFVQSSTNPLQVTWCASVQDDGSTSPCQDSNGTSAPASLTDDPSLTAGVLDFYVGPAGSATSLVCSTDVGPTIDYADCTTTLESIGEQTVVTEYLSDTVSVSSTETVDVPPAPTTTTVTYSPLAALPTWSVCGVTEDGAPPGTYIPTTGSPSYCQFWSVNAAVTSQGSTVTGAATSITVNYGSSSTTFTVASGSSCDIALIGIESTSSDVLTGVPIGDWEASAPSVQPPGSTCTSTQATPATVDSADPGTLPGPSVSATFAASDGYAASSSTAVTFTGVSP